MTYPWRGESCRGFVGDWYDDECSCNYLSHYSGVAIDGSLVVRNLSNCKSLMLSRSCHEVTSTCRDSTSSHQVLATLIDAFCFGKMAVPRPNYKTFVVPNVVRETSRHASPVGDEKFLEGGGETWRLVVFGLSNVLDPQFSHLKTFKIIILSGDSTVLLHQNGVFQLMN